MRYATLLLACLTLAHGAFFGAAPARAQPSELQVKADYLPRFVRYVQWPEERAPAAGAPFRLCVVGSDPFGPLLDEAAASQTVRGHAIEVQRHDTVADAQSCHLAFVQGTTPEDTARILDLMEGLPVLTITDGREAQRHGLIHFVSAAGRVRFFIDEAAAVERGLTISARLLALALGVRQRRL